MDDFKTKFVSALAGALMGWAGTSLTLVGRVAALESGQARIEQTMGRVLQAVERVK
jgi:hypothetical protein